MINPKRYVSETPSGVINGVNKVFTTTKKIGYVEKLLVGGSEYLDYTISGNTITMTDAPLTGYEVIIDYFIN